MNKLSQTKQQNRDKLKKTNTNDDKLKMVASQHLAQSFNEVKLMRDGKIPQRSRKEIKDEL